MTIVRRPGRVTRSCPVPGSDDFWKQLEPSPEAFVKSESTRIVLEEHLNAVMRESTERKHRYEVFQTELQSKCFSEEEKEALSKEFFANEQLMSRLSRSRMNISRFTKIRLIGRGGFGEVYLVQDKFTHELYALKILRKSDVILQDQISNVRTERDVLSSADNRWMVTLHASFQDAENLYLVLEYVPGGDLMTAMIRADIFPEATARFFTGEIAMALHSIHSMNVIHGDLKMENILIREDGHIKLTDFGLSTRYEKSDNRVHKVLDEVMRLMNEQYKLGINRAQHVRGSAIGTYGYTAPELLKGGQPTTASDFWSLGVMLYEMLYGFAPFNGKSPSEVLLRVVHYQKSLVFPQSRGISPVAVDLLKHLLCEPEERYGFEDLVRHEFFAGFDFSPCGVNIPPMVPVLVHPADTTHFDDIEERTERVACPDDELTRTAFLGFTYKLRPKNMTLAKLGIFA